MINKNKPIYRFRNQVECRNVAMNHQKQNFAHFAFGVPKNRFFDKTSLARMLNDYEKFQDNRHTISIDKFTKSSIRIRS